MLKIHLFSAAQSHAVFKGRRLKKKCEFRTFERAFEKLERWGKINGCLLGRFYPSYSQMLQSLLLRQKKKEELFCLAIMSDASLLSFKTSCLWALCVFNHGVVYTLGI